jgi:hypothetical protein
MAEESDQKISLCAFDYFPGTVTTAYKGPIQSLVISDFCIEASGSRIEIKGRVINLPEGTYQLILLSEGKTLSKTETKDGTFSFWIEREDFQKLGHLQIDFLQKGRHIGTFLIKAIKEAGPLTSAMEVSMELEGINLRRLVRLVEGRYGLKRKAEHLVAEALSPKRQWYDFSVELYGFSKDLFWIDRNAFSEWIPFIIRFLLLSIRQLPGQRKPILNIESILELIEKEGELPLAEKVLEILESELERYPFDLSVRFIPLMRLISSLVKKAQVQRFRPVLFLLNSLERAIERITPLPNELLKALNNDPALQPFTDNSLEILKTALKSIKKSLKEGSPSDEIEKTIENIDLRCLDPVVMTKAVFSVVKKQGIEGDEIMARVLPMMEKLLEDALQGMDIFAEELVHLTEGLPERGSHRVCNGGSAFF